MNTLNVTMPTGNGDGAKSIHVMFGVLPKEVNKAIAQAYRKVRTMREIVPTVQFLKGEEPKIEEIIATNRSWSGHQAYVERLATNVEEAGSEHDAARISQGLVEKEEE